MGQPLGWRCSSRSAPHFMCKGASSNLTLHVPRMCQRISCQHAAAPPPAAAATTAADTASGSLAAAERDLRTWIHSHGGFIHPHLAIADPAPCSARGIVAIQPVTMEDLEQGPVISIPLHLHLDTKRAIAILQEAVTNQQQQQQPGHGSEPLCVQTVADEQQLSSMQLVGAALALERSKGAASDWAPYIKLLPEDPPCPWMDQQHSSVVSRLHLVLGQPTTNHGAAPPSTSGSLAAEQPTPPSTTAAAAAAAEAAGVHLAGSTEPTASPTDTASTPQLAAAWASNIQQEHDMMLSEAEHVAAALAPAIQLPTQEVLWGMAQVLSRSLGTHAGSGLVPYVDLLNHAHTARPPMITLDDADQLAVTVLPMFEDEAAPLAAGQELYINYMGGFTPLEAYKKFGFVAPEWW